MNTTEISADIRVRTIVKDDRGLFIVLNFGRTDAMSFVLAGDTYLVAGEERSWVSLDEAIDFTIHRHRNDPPWVATPSTIKSVGGGSDQVGGLPVEKRVRKVKGAIESANQPILF